MSRAEAISIRPPADGDDRAFARDSAAGVVRIDGRMIDKPHLRAAEAILATAPKGAA